MALLLSTYFVAAYATFILKNSINCGVNLKMI